MMRVWVEDARVGRTLLSDAFDVEFSIVPQTMTPLLFPDLTATVKCVGQSLPSEVVTFLISLTGRC